MRRTELLQEIRKMRFEEAYEEAYGDWGGHRYAHEIMRFYIFKRYEKTMPKKSG